MDWEPTLVPLGLLLEITDGFSAERKLGSGSYGEVYLGVHKDGQKIAVKRIYDMPGIDEKQFQNEFKNLTMLRHQNIVRLVGYCHDIQEVQVKHEGKLVVADKIQRALCLEYMSNGSLEKYLSDECDKYDWCTCYGIIKGVCQGVKYLHNELTPPIYHLDLKPANILLDENMVPRIADFGISRLFGDEKTRATISSLGTIGYLPPEYIRNNLISSKFDIFSLGVVIIKIMAGRVGYFKSAEMSSWEFTNLVQENWTNRLHETSNLKKAYSEQVKKCIEIGLSCVQEDRHKRPTIQDIVDRLNETETECTYEYKKFDECWNLGGHPVREVLLNYDAGPSQQEFGDRRPLNGFSQAAVLSNNDAGPSNRETLPSSQPTYGQILHQGLGEYDPSMSQNGNVLNDQGPLSAESTMPFYNFLTVPQDVEDVAGTYPDGVSLGTSSLNPVPVVVSSGPPSDKFDYWLDKMLAVGGITPANEFGERHPFLQQNEFSRAEVLPHIDAGPSKQETLLFSHHNYEQQTLHQGLGQHVPSMPQNETPYYLPQGNILTDQGSFSAQPTVPSHILLPVQEDDDLITGASLSSQQNGYSSFSTTDAPGTSYPATTKLTGEGFDEQQQIQRQIWGFRQWDHKSG